MQDLEKFFGPNAGYALELYERYQQNPDAVDPATRAIFEKWAANGGSSGLSNGNGFSNGNGNGANGATVSSNGKTATVKIPTEERPVQTPVTTGVIPQTDGQSQPQDGSHWPPFQIPHVVAAVGLAHSIRERGHLGAHLDPLGSPPLGDPALLPETHGITDDDLARLPSNVVGGHAAAGAKNALEAITRLRAMYSGHISYEFDQIKNPTERRWLRDAVGGQLYQEPRRPNSARQLLRSLTRVESFERYLHQTFVGQKRFSIEGTDTLVPMLEEIVEQAGNTGAREVIIGMAHRGRLNVLAHVLKKPYAAIISEFMHTKTEDNLASTYEGSSWSGDVKYHLGAEQVIKEDGKASLKVILSPNPSHLEFVNPVIQGFARASQEGVTIRRPGTPQQDVDCSLPVLIHGDAAFPGEGIVAETLNLWNLRGYKVGGTIHIIANNQIGFTTEPTDGRSTHFASDLAKGFEMPIIHVNADDPDACLTAVRMAKAWRDEFHKDIMVDLVGYRRWGHNEGDEPAFTQPQMYEIIRSHPTVREIYAHLLEREGLIGPGEADAMLKEAYSELEQAKKLADEGHNHTATDNPVPDLDGDPDGYGKPQPVDAEQLTLYNQALLSWPEGFAPNPKLGRLLQRRVTSINQEGGIDWGHAEALAFASILAEGTPIRLTGQDAERGTFSHRHAVLHDGQTGATFTPLQYLPQAKASFSIYNSPISEGAVLGFEYGYSVRADEALVLWEAQFGDFANVGQVIIDQFISSGRQKWKQKSSLVLLLPHGYEGQGPEHSSARPERYLALCAKNNWKIANCSTAGQYFHLLRQQAHEMKSDPRPLVVFSPKSLLRHPLAGTSLRELTEGLFQPVIDDQRALANARNIQRIVLCTGKVAIDMLAHSARAQAEDVAIVRVEQLYPFPTEELKQVVANYPNAKELVWVQEEPQNMGVWRFMFPRLFRLFDQEKEIKVIARPEQASPATGFADQYAAEQEQIIKSALRLPVKR
jgi:2-oxoglutarate dehydrogenase E1 component